MKFLRRLKFVGLLMFLLAVPSVYAFEFLNQLSRFFYYLQSAMRDLYIIYGFTFLLMFALQTSIIMAAMRKVDIFKKKNTINKQGKIVAVCIALLSNFAIFYWAAQERGMERILVDVLSPFGIFGGLVIAAVMFILIYSAFKDEDKSKAWKAGLVGAGIALMTFSLMLSYPNILWLGFLAMLIGLILLLFSMIERKPDEDSYGKPESFSIPKEKPSSGGSAPATSKSSEPSKSSGAKTPSGGRGQSEQPKPKTARDEEDIKRKIKELLNDIDQHNAKVQEMVDKVGSADNRLNLEESARWH